MVSEELVLTFTGGDKQKKYYFTELMVFNDLEYAVFYSLENDLHDPIFLKIQGDMLLDIEDEKEYNLVKSYWDKLEEFIEEEKEIEEEIYNQ